MHDPMSHVDPETGEITEPEPTIVPFAAWLQDFQRGRLHDRLTDDLAKLVGAVRDLGKKGTLSLTIEVKPSEVHSTQMIVTTKTDLKEPRAGIAPVIFWADDDGNLLDHDPLNVPFPQMRDIPRPKES